MNVHQIEREEILEMIKAGLAMLALAVWLWAGMCMAALVDAKPGGPLVAQSGPARIVMEQSTLMAKGYPSVLGVRE